ncbi:MAG: O-antigen ligase family protein [Bryobacteraceae bacterium]
MLNLLPVVAALTVLLIVPGLLFHFDVTPKVAVLLVGTAVCLLDLTGVRRAMETLWAQRRGRWLIAILAAQWCSLALSTALSSHPELSVAGSAWRRFGLVTQTGLLVFTLLLAGWLVLDAGNLKRFFRATIVTGILASLYGILQYFGVDPILSAHAYMAGEAEWTIVRPPSTLGHAGYFATFALYPVFAALALLTFEDHPVWRWISGLACVTGIAAIVLSGTRSALLGLAMGLVMVLARLRPKLGRKHALAAALIVAASLALYLSPAGLRLRWRTRWYVEDVSGGARLTLWNDSLRMATEHLAAGYGPETFGNEFPRRQSLVLARAHPDFYQESPHNVFLDVLVAQGAPGLLAFAALSALALFSIRGAPPAIQIAGAGFAAGLVSQQFLCFTVPTAVFFYSMALVPIVHADPVRPTRRIGWASIPVALLLSLLLAAFAVRLVISDWKMAEVKSALLTETPAAVAARYEQALRWKFPGGNPDLYYAREMLNLSNRQTDPKLRFQAWQHSMGAAVRAATALEDRPNALVNLAAFQSVMNNPAMVENTLLTAAREAPQWYRPHWLLARLYLLAGRLPQAEEQARAAVERNGGHDAAVQQTLDQVLTVRHSTQKALAP